MDFGEAVRTCLSKYATFEGRASRSEYWWFVLFEIMVIFGGMLIAGILGAAVGGHNSNMGVLLISLVLAVSILGLFLPRLAVTVRRLHDTDHSGAYFLIVFLPFGGIFLLIWACSRGTAGANKYGNNPLSYDSQGLAETFR